MICTKCDNELGECICPDLRETIEKLKRAEFLIISPKQMARYEAQIKRNEEQQSRAE